MITFFGGGSFARLWEPEKMRGEIRPMLRLAVPLVLAEIGWVAMGIVDTMMVGRLPESAVAIGAVSLGSILFFTIAIYGSALLLGLDTLVSQAYGAGDLDRCNRALWNGLWICAPLAPVLVVVVEMAGANLHRFNIQVDVRTAAAPYLQAVKWSAPPLLLYFTVRRYLQAIGAVRIITFAMISANLVNAVGNWALIYGHFGMPAMGVPGSAWATFAARIYMAAVLAGAVLWHNRRDHLHLFRAASLPDFGIVKRLLELGLPAATHVGLEMGVFAAATALISTLDARSLAAHQIALNAASFTFMVPLGISSAAAVRVGQELGRGRMDLAAQAGWTAIALGAGFMACAAVAFLTVPEWIARAYTPDRTVIAAAVALLAIAAVFQLFDGLQIVCAGALRGAGETKSPMMANLIFYWFLGLPLGWALGFRMGLGARGMWAGLCLGLMLIGSTLLIVWRRKTQDFARLTKAIEARV
jgi:multidrug resistance protein, MATE family